MAVTNKLGANFADLKDKIKFKTIKIEWDGSEYDLKIRVPLKREIEEMTQRILNPDRKRVDDFYNEFTANLISTFDDDNGELLEVINKDKQTLIKTDDDIILDGTSLRQFAMFKVMEMVKIEEHFHLLQSETDMPIDESYQDIVDEFPEQFVKVVVSAIEKAIRPDYLETKKG